MEPDTLERRQMASHPSGEVQMLNSFGSSYSVLGWAVTHNIIIYIRQQADYHPKRFLFIRVQSSSAHPVFSCQVDK
jgi:hypothetical protein